jgi:hypothetical protein
LGQEIRIVVPNALADAEGNSAAPNFSGGFRAHILYPQSEFESLPDTHRLITGFAFRPDAAVTVSRSVTFDIELRLSTTLKTPDDLETTYQNNVGPDETVVLTDVLQMSTEAAGPPEGPRPFDYVIEFTTPFFYDPADGNLLVDIISPTGYSPATLDDQDSSLAQVSGLGATSITGSRNFRGPVMQFIFVPEPSTAALSAIGWICLLRWRRKIAA